MDIKKPKTENFSLKNVAWGTREFDEIINNAKQQQEQHDLKFYCQSTKRSEKNAY